MGVNFDNPNNFYNSNVIIVSSKDKLPSSSGGVITLLPNTTYLIVNHIDLTGDRIVTSGSTCIMGMSSENCSLTSTGLVGNALITSAYTLDLRHILIKDVTTAINLSGSTSVFDWFAVNFLNVQNVGSIGNCSNFIFNNGSFFNSQNLIFNGEVGTISFDKCLFTSSSGVVITIDSTAIINRRFRITFSSFVTTGAGKSINVNVSASIPVESYILDNINFSGGVTYLQGIDHTSNLSLFRNCVGITNTFVYGQLFMNDNLVATPIAQLNTFYKVLGTTLPSPDMSKYEHSDNRLTCKARIRRTYTIICTLSFNSGNNDVCKFGYRDSVLGDVRLPSRTKSTANAAGRAENVTFPCNVTHGFDDYLEIWCANTSSLSSVVVTDMNFIIK